MSKNQSEVLFALARHPSLFTHHCRSGFLAELILSVRPPVGGSIVPETSVCLYAESTTYVKFLESAVEGLSMTVPGLSLYLVRRVGEVLKQLVVTCKRSIRGSGCFYSSLVTFHSPLLLRLFAGFALNQNTEILPRFALGRNDSIQNRFSATCRDCLKLTGLAQGVVTVVCERPEGILSGRRSIRMLEKTISRKMAGPKKAMLTSQFCKRSLRCSPPNRTKRLKTTIAPNP